MDIRAHLIIPPRISLQLLSLTQRRVSELVLIVLFSSKQLTLRKLANTVRHKTSSGKIEVELSLVDRRVARNLASVMSLIRVSNH